MSEKVTSTSTTWHLRSRYRLGHAKGVDRRELLRLQASRTGVDLALIAAVKMVAALRKEIETA